MSVMSLLCWPAATFSRIPSSKQTRRLSIRLTTDARPASVHEYPHTHSPQRISSFSMMEGGALGCALRKTIRYFPLLVSILLLWSLLLVSAGSHLSGMTPSHFSFSLPCLTSIVSFFLLYTVDECKASSVSPAYHVISSSKPLNNITMADQVTLLISRTGSGSGNTQKDPTSICNDKVLGLAQEWMMRDIVGSKASAQGHIQDKQQTMYARLMSVGE